MAQALTDGFRLAYLIGAGLAAAAALMTFTSLPRLGTAAGERRGAALCACDRRRARGFRRAHDRVRGLPCRSARAVHEARRLQLRDRAVASPARRSAAPSGRPRRSWRRGYIFTANFYDLNEPPIVGQSGPLILDRRLQPVLVPAGARKARRRQPQPADL